MCFTKIKQTSNSMRYTRFSILPFTNYGNVTLLHYDFLNGNYLYIICFNQISVHGLQYNTIFVLYIITDKYIILPITELT